MTKQLIRLTAVLAAMAVIGGVATAETDVRIPYLHVKSGPKAEVKAPVARVAVPAERSFDGEPLPLPKEVPMVVWRVEDFGRAFKPEAGYYEVYFLHPYTGCPVKVCFELPCGCPCKVKVSCNELEWDYGKIEVEIDFFRSGRVKVQHRD